MQIIGHRGASGYAPENTLASFQEAIYMGVDMIELDVYALKTGQVVVIHDDTVDRTTNGTGHVVQYSYEQLRELDAGHGQKVPLLTEVLDLIDRRMPINIELKARGTAVPVATIIRQYVAQKGWSSSLFLVSSFDHHELRKFAALVPSIRLSPAFDTNPKDYWVVRKKDYAVSTTVESALLNNKNVHAAHRRGLKVFAYTVNSRREAKRLRALKVDGIFTNYPDKFLAHASH